MDLTLDDTMMEILDDDVLDELEKVEEGERLDGRRRLEMLREEKRLRDYLNEVWFDDEEDDDGL